MYTELIFHLNQSINSRLCLELLQLLATKQLTYTHDYYPKNVNLCILSVFYICISQPKHPWCKKSRGQELKKGQDKKDVKSNWVAKASGVDEIKIFDNDDKAAKRSFLLVEIESSMYSRYCVVNLTRLVDTCHCRGQLPISATGLCNLKDSSSSYGQAPHKASIFCPRHGLVDCVAYIGVLCEIVGVASVLGFVLFPRIPTVAVFGQENPELFVVC